MEYSHAYHAEQPTSPPEAEPQATKKIKVHVRFSGVSIEELEVPADLDTENVQAVADALADYSPYPDGFWHLGLGELWAGQNDFKDTAPWYDRDRARVWIEDVEEE